MINQGIMYALLAALLFGAGTPFAKLLVGQTAPMALAGLLYLGSGLGLCIWIAIRRLGRKAEADASLTASDLPWLAATVLTGGIIGPVLLMNGLVSVPASSASLLLNMEGVFTALLAWFVFREQFDRRIFIGMLLIVLAGALLSWEKPFNAAQTVSWGALCIVAACLCWAIDNNLTRKIAGSDAVQIAAVKGMVAGSVNLLAAYWIGLPMPSLGNATAATMVGFCGYGLSLVLFVLALRHLGTARTSAYFSAAPFVGAAIALWMPGDTPDTMFWLAAALMAAGIWLHATERHEHAHEHETMSHAHAHTHDEHHRHEHDFSWDGKEPHSHPHRHEALTHAHPHFPDIHHRHRH